MIRKIPTILNRNRHPIPFRQLIRKESLGKAKVFEVGNTLLSEWTLCDSFSLKTVDETLVAATSISSTRWGSGIPLASIAGADDGGVSSEKTLGVVD